MNSLSICMSRFLIEVSKFINTHKQDYRFFFQLLLLCFTLVLVSSFILLHLLTIKPVEFGTGEFIFMPTMMIIIIIETYHFSSLLWILFCVIFQNVFVLVDADADIVATTVAFSRWHIVFI